MCDDSTERDNAHWLAQKRLGRRELGVLGATVTAAVLVPGCDSETEASSDGGAGGTSAGGSSAGGSNAGGSRAGSGGMSAGGTSAASVKTKSEMVSIETPDGTADAFFVHPETGNHAAIIVWPDILGLRDAYKMLGTHVAEAGYAVLVVNQYYRNAPAPVLSSWDEWRTDAGKAKLEPMIAALKPAAIMSDADAFIQWLDKQAGVDAKKKVGTCGYCMGGPFTFRTAASRADRVGALASLHGGGLVTDADDSPHKLLEKVEASMLIAIAQNDDQRQPEAKTTLMESAKAAGLDAEIEVYPAQHGWCASDSTAYDEAQADKALSRMLALFSKALG
jgi:carboxymethylenebutenolidase